jgi:hypothetical protein
MSKARDDEPVSVLKWMLLILLVSLPCVGLVAIVVLAFVGENQTRRNYFRALIAWFLIVLTIWIAWVVLVLVFGAWPEMEPEIRKWWARFLEAF